MPYIKNEDRTKFHEGFDNIWPSSAGELNYVFTSIINNYISLKKENYQTYNDIMGALEGCKLELYRRKIASYEDTKIESNGDVFFK